MTGFDEYSSHDCIARSTKMTTDTRNAVRPAVRADSPLSKPPYAYPTATPTAIARAPRPMIPQRLTSSSRSCSGHHSTAPIAAVVRALLRARLLRQPAMIAVTAQAMPMANSATTIGPRPGLRSQRFADT
jgi:hypothetical protein